MTRLLSTAALGRRVAFLDNVKSLRLSWADLEALITADVISGRQLYVGEGRRPNTLTWLITLNNASLSKDLAQRTVIIRLKRPPHDPRWEEETWALIEQRRWEIIGDVLAELRRQVKPLKQYSRWSAWEQGVLAHVVAPAECQRVIEERQGAVDDDQAEADLVREKFVEELRRVGFDPEADVVWITSAEAARVVNEATGELRPKNKATAFLGTLGVRELRRSNRGDKGRGWVWRGIRAKPDAQVVSFETAKDPFTEQRR